MAKKNAESGQAKSSNKCGKRKKVTVESDTYIVTEMTNQNDTYFFCPNKLCDLER